MKKIILRSLLFACTIGLLWSCKKGEMDLVNKVSTTEGLAFIKIIHAAPNFRQIYKGADSFNVYVNGAKINGTFLTYNALFPTATNLYVAVPSGAQSIRVSVNGTTTPDSITLGSLNKTLEVGSYYSLVITDEVFTGNESRQMWIKDNFALTDTNNYTVRFIHAVLNDPGAVDVYSFQKGKNIFNNITPTTATPFVSLPYTILTDTFYVRTAGTQTDIAKITLANGSTTALNRGRAYTLLYKGQFGNLTKPRSLTLFANN